MEGESLHVTHVDGVEMIVAIHSTRRGPALGGCRWKPYPDSAAARRDALDLARAMTRKAALARLSLGGGKAVVVADPRTRTPAQLYAFGDFVDSLEGRYITAADMGTGQQEMAQIAQRTRHVVGLPASVGGCGDPGPYTAHGVRLALVAALEHEDVPLQGARVAIQGAGSVGAELARLLLADGARVIAADPDPGAIGALPDAVEVVAPESVADVECEVFAPCGPPGVIDVPRASRLACRVVCGASNNPLADAAAAKILHERGVLYVPDFLANAGGLIHLACAREGGDADASLRALKVIPENLAAVIERARRDAVDLARAAEDEALERIDQV